MMKKTIIPYLLVLLSTTIVSTGEAQLLPTSLKITVIDGLGNPVENAVVALFKSKDDYINSQEPVDTAMTDEKGQVKFKKLEPISYYIDARKGGMNNDGEGVATEPLQEGRTNKVNTVIE